MTAPRAGVRVVEIASFVAAPSAGALLADLGADVTKVSPAFETDSRAKRALALDPTRPEAVEALLRVIDGAGKPARIHATLNGCGTRGDDADRPAFEAGLADDESAKLLR